jgi:hypothetical protein
MVIRSYSVVGGARLCLSLTTTFSCGVAYCTLTCHVNLTLPASDGLSVAGNLGLLCVRHTLAGIRYRCHLLDGCFCPRLWRLLFLVG